MKSEETGNVCEEGGEKRGDSKYHLREPPTPPKNLPEGISEIGRFRDQGKRIPAPKKMDLKKIFPGLNFAPLFEWMMGVE
ncbi:hypothetical protein TNCV_4600231 [Trichonephila clavipes]|nr:hypothetical protein TNCV_4600231 [Trichonephila clavipes]